MFEQMTLEGIPSAISLQELEAGHARSDSQAGPTTGQSGQAAPPCQPFSAAGKRAGFADRRDLWPHFYGLIDAVRPPVVMGEQVDAAVRHGWLDRARTDLAASGYACRAAIVPACSVNAPHKRERLWFVADAGGAGLSQREIVSGVRREQDGTEPGQTVAGGCAVLGNTDSDGRQSWRETSAPTRYRGAIEPAGFWDDAEWFECGDGKRRRVKPGVRLLANGVPARVAKLRALGNAIVPQVAAEIVRAYMEAA